MRVKLKNKVIKLFKLLKQINNRNKEHNIISK
jgi:hypothetical protein